MERSRPPRLRPIERVLRVARQVFDHVPEPEAPTHWRPSPQRDVGKSALRASEVSTVIANMGTSNSLGETTPDSVQ